MPKSDGGAVLAEERVLPPVLFTEINEYTTGWTYMGETCREAYNLIPAQYKVDLNAAADRFRRIPKEMADLGFQPKERGRVGIRTVKSIAINTAWDSSVSSPNVG